MYLYNFPPTVQLNIKIVIDGMYWTIRHKIGSYRYHRQGHLKMQIVSNDLFSLIFHVGMNIADIAEKTYNQHYLHLYSMNCRTLRTE